MSNVQIHLVVEGATEQTFVRDVLSPEMALTGVYLHAVEIGPPGHKGGNIRFDRAQTDIGNFLKQRGDIYVSTMFDFFRINPEWPGKNEVQKRIQDGASLSASQKADILESAMHNAIQKAFPALNPKERFIPYIEMHEFEALLFSDAQKLADIVGIDIGSIEKVLEEYDNPEEINDGPETAPSKRLLALKNGYKKVAKGKAVSEAIGIQAIRRQCPHFNNWLKKLENLRHDIDSRSS
jgi:Domain of unknown function (DUF4276)